MIHKPVAWIFVVLDAYAPAFYFGVFRITIVYIFYLKNFKLIIFYDLM
jgi:hypothetical protein